MMMAVDIFLQYKVIDNSIVQ